ncbi:MAG: carboxypeptidase-like regulatory domain-containing protein [Pseudomonadota bacterium]
MNDKSKIENKELHTAIKIPGWATIVSVVSGLAFLVILLIIAVFIAHPTDFQIFIFRIVIALAAAAFGATIPGFLKIDLPVGKKGLITAGGAIAFFVLIYFMNPPKLVSDKPLPPEIIKQPLMGFILDQEGEPLPGVSVTVLEHSVNDATDGNGKFSFEIKAEKNSSVRLMAQKQGFKTHRQDVTLGNTNLSFKMDKKP